MIRVNKQNKHSFYTVLYLNDTSATVTCFDVLSQKPDAALESADELTSYIKAPEPTGNFADYSVKYFSGETLDASLTGKYVKTQGKGSIRTDMDEYSECSVVTIGIKNGSITPPRNAFAETFNTKNGIVKERNLCKDVPLLQAAIINETNKMYETMVVFSTSDKGYRIIDESSVVCEPIVLSTPGFTDCLHYIPSIKLSGATSILPDTTAEIQCEIFRHGEYAEKELTLFLESTGGYLPQRRVSITGKGVIRFSTQGLLAGEQVKIKAGWKHYPGISELIITIK
jgi:hypothetical protein